MDRRKSVCRKRFPDTDSSHDKHDSPARTWSRPRRRRDTPAPTCPHPHAPAYARTPRRPKTTTTVLCWDFRKGLLFNFFFKKKKLFGHFEYRNFPKKHKKAESECRAQQQRGSNARYHQHVLMPLRSAFLVRSSEVLVFCVGSCLLFGFQVFSFHLGMRT